MWRVYGGALIVIAGIAAFITAHTNRPIAAYEPPGDSFEKARAAAAGARAVPAMGMSQTAYDILRIGACALVILGGLTVILGLIRYARTA